jgi:hypothetical protein
MNVNSVLNLRSDLFGVVIRADGSHRDLGLLSQGWLQKTVNDILTPIYRVYLKLRKALVIGAISFAAWLAVHYGNNHPYVQMVPMFGLVTTAGANYMAADFLTASTSRINAFAYHDCGEGTTAEAIGQTALVTPAGTARVLGTGTNSSANVYQSVATISFTGAKAITEWGLFSAATVGTMWDRRMFAVINVGSGDSVQFTYQLTVPAGGS